MFALDRYWLLFCLIGSSDGFSRYQRLTAYKTCSGNRHSSIRRHRHFELPHFHSAGIHSTTKLAALPSEEDAGAEKADDIDASSISEEIASLLERLTDNNDGGPHELGAIFVEIFVTRRTPKLY